MNYSILETLPLPTFMVYFSTVQYVCVTVYNKQRACKSSESACVVILIISQLNHCTTFLDKYMLNLCGCGSLCKLNLAVCSVVFQPIMQC